MRALRCRETGSIWWQTLLGVACVLPIMCCILAWLPPGFLVCCLRACSGHWLVLPTCMLGWTGKKWPPRGAVPNSNWWAWGEILLRLVIPRVPQQDEDLVAQSGNELENASFLGYLPSRLTSPLYWYRESLLERNCLHFRQHLRICFWGVPKLWPRILTSMAVIFLVALTWLMAVPS